MEWPRDPRVSRAAKVWVNLWQSKRGTDLLLCASTKKTFLRATKVQDREWTNLKQINRLLP